ncbi:hypothetical protein [Acetivibrio mesophilus]|uniref:Replicative DNA helicase n=1 Tax=Acetivibrio mesophilus TaxID=2487273 RepID=A0A4Q0I6V7_9FIRM|nr:hypothetical protein [Acetivibrio mesophilus]ODM25527.1 hypothetical protein A7W90_04405 [Clostridium sp. Bc-iso-3]RXE60111.1 hypothetical protein EFD62_02435 [Acetivibrio mesophilus]HHV29135.1 hypothetical protein [Clostridium sp.]
MHQSKAYEGTALDCLKDFRQRMNNLAPFIHLSRKLIGFQKYSEVDMISVGFSVLLFILENMLIGREECSIEDIADFLQTILRRSYDINMTQEESREMAFYIRDSIAGSGGEVFEFSFRNLETNRDESISLKLIDTSYYEIKKSARYKLTDRGMELLFKTREIYSEFRINITQMYLKQQIEKGVFSGALQTVNELNLQVRQLREKLESLLLNIRQNVLGIDFEDLKQLFSRIKEQFEVERREFHNIKRILKEQRENLEKINYFDLEENELKSLEQIKILTEKLNITTSEHDRLFNEKLDIVGEYLKTIEIRLRQGVSEFIDFEKSIFDMLISKNLNPQPLKSILSPLFTNNASLKVFNPFKALDPQRIKTEAQEDERENIDIEVAMEIKEKELREERERRDQKVMAYLEAILFEAFYAGESYLSCATERLDADLYDMASFDFDFYSLVIILHQNKLIDFKDLEDILSRMVRDTSAYNINIYYLFDRIFTKKPELRALKTLILISTDKKMSFQNGNEITDFIIKGEK